VSGNLQTQINTKANSSDLTNYTLLSTTSSVSGNLQTQINTKANSSDLTNYTLLSTTSSVSGNLQTQINTKANSSDLTNYTLLSTTSSVSGNLQTQINNHVNNNHVNTLNNLVGNVTIVPGSNIVITPNNNQLVISSNISGGITSKRTLGFNIVSTSVVTSGVKDTMVVCPFSGTIVDWVATCSPSSSVSLDILKGSLMVPISSIITSDHPTINNQISLSSNVSGWNTTVNTNDVFKIKVNSNTSAKIITLQLGIL
jgi:hypothetical protein